MHLIFWNRILIYLLRLLLKEKNAYADIAQFFFICVFIENAHLYILKEILADGLPALRSGASAEIQFYDNLCVIEFFISHLGSLKKTTGYQFYTFNVMTADELGWHVD